MGITVNDKLRKFLQDGLDRMKWSDGVNGVYYYHDPKHINREPVCAIKKGYGLECAVYTVFWNGWNVVGCSDLDVLKKDVEQKHRIDTMKVLSYKKNK